ncbi:ATP-binding protein [Streptomyces sp. NBC_01259]
MASAAYEMDSGQIARTRGFVREFLSTLRTQHGMPVSQRAADTAQLVVSELATNVAKYAPGPCRLDLEAAGSTLSISMWDYGSQLPVPAKADPTRLGRHGLEIVLMVCKSFEVHRETLGKHIRVQITLHDPADEDRTDAPA